MVTLFLHTGCTAQAPSTSSVTKPSLTPAVFAEGQRLYEKQCAVCHGMKGMGDGPAAYLLYPKPRDFTQNEFRLVSTSTMQATDDDLFLTITRGMPGSAMPSWETLTPQQRWALVYYVRHLTGATEPIDPASIIPVPPETPKTVEGVARGREIFAQACASCHGPEGKGDLPAYQRQAQAGGQQVMIPPPAASAEGGSAPEAQALRAAVGGGMTDNAGFPVKPRDLTAGVFKGSSESGDLYYRIIGGLPGSPMPSYAGVYSDEQVWDLIHYVQSLVPPGVEERVRLQPRTIHAKRIRGSLPTEPAAPAWGSIEPTYVAVTPLWWRDARTEGVEVTALHDGKELAILLSWDDQTQDASLLKPQSFSDGAAVQFSAMADPPFFGMGDASGVVSIWHWKAAWQEDLAGWKDLEHAYPHAAVDWYPAQRDYRHGEPFEVQQAKTASQDPEFMSGWGAANPLSDPRRASAGEEAMAKGLGTITSRPPQLQRIQATGQWQEGRWRVVLHRPMAGSDEHDLRLKAGQAVSVAFAVWDGDAKDRNGQKSVSIWQTLRLER